MEESFWRVWTNAKSEVKCRGILNQILMKLNQPDLEVKYEAHWESKRWIGNFTLLINCNSKEELMFEVIRRSQLIGYNWHLTGSIESQSSATSMESSVSGVEMAEWQVDIPSKWN
ncbi:hypothetical protein [Fulvivirga ligni]|uniref:hypothetical protein n=1 Tax=Fulvivirga ligni TaxID=2904246 RepID=UPI001F3C53B1|nr:hypothetical protein [Fulvivirga ligni]UII20513.1 hypothetical protein LVD16_21985 [Fulvivirga ligni]